MSQNTIPFSGTPEQEAALKAVIETHKDVKGSGDILEKVKEILGIDVGECTPDGKFSIDATRCIGACGLAPVITVNDEVYGRLTVDDIPGIIQQYQEA